ncbi:MAG: hypothetical protein IKN14_05150 [Clostridiales bacterium]|nr:hypothetical protein [Clostridiales bacterium]
MELEYGNSGFVPYDSFEYIYKERELPEFGNVVSPYVRTISTWNFFLATGEGEIPFGFESQSFDDSEWELINTPSSWQTEGYGLPQNLLYNYPVELGVLAKRGEESISDKYILHSTNSEDEQIGLYRASVLFTEEDIDRALYLEFSGICGKFEVYLNGQRLAASGAVMTDRRVLLSDSAKPGMNQLAIAVYRWDRDKHGKIIKELMNFGFSGIIRPISVVAESLLELSNIHIRISDVPAAYVDTMTTAIATRQSSVAKVQRGDFMVKVDFRLKNHTDLIMPYNVRVSVLEARAEYDPYKLPYIKMNMQLAPGGTITSGEELRDECEFIALDVAKWSDATPVQYDIVLEVLDSENRTICAKRRRFGFRTAEIMMDKFHINDKPVKLNLVKYYEFDPQGGICVPTDRFRQDIILMKRAGINGIIGQGFPLSDTLLDLCDQYGLYVIASADRRYMKEYMESAMNHPSVIMWGIQEYGFDAEKCARVKAALQKLDDTRPWYCEADRTKKISDLAPFPTDAGAVYGPWEDLCLDRSRIFSKNKTGKNLFESIPGRSHFSDDDSDYKWIHHADLVGGKQKANSSIGQGIVDAERNPHPVFLDIKRQCSNIDIFPSPSDPTSLVLRNTHPFAYTPEVRLEWKVLLGGNKVMSGGGNINEIEPDGTRNLRFPLNIAKYLKDGWAEGKAELIDMYMEALSHEIVFDISLKLSKDTYYANEGYEIAFYQDVLAPECANPVAITEDNRPRLGSGAAPASDPDAPAIEGPEGGLIRTSSDEEKDTAEVMSGEGISPDKIVGGLTPELESKIDEQIENAMLTMDAIANAPKHETKIDPIVNKFKVISMPEYITVGNADSSFKFDRRTGAVCDIEVGGKHFIRGSFMPSFYRCPSNIDRTDRSFILAKTIFSKETDYEAIQQSLEFDTCRYGIENGVFSLVSRYRSFAMKGDILIAYEIPSSNMMKITMSFTPKYDLVRYGFRVPVEKDGMLCSWYGRGPGESYYDRKDSARIGYFAAGADKIYHPYARPAENSSHTDTAAMQLSFDKKTLKVTRTEGKKFDFTILPFTPEQMNDYLHEEQLMQNDTCELFVDFCSKEIERTSTNNTGLPLRKNVDYKDSFVISLK